MRIKFNQATLDKLERDIGAKARAIAKNPEMLAEVANIVIKDITYQVRAGRSPIDGQKLKPLSQSWKEQRGLIAQATSTHDAYSRNKSNLTLTGQLIDSLRKKIVGSSAFIYFEGVHKPYRKKFVNQKKSGSYQVGKSIKNEDLAKYVAENGREFLGVREKLLDQLKKVVIKYIRRKL